VPDYVVFSEVGYKESARSESMAPEHWIDYLNEDIAAGATKVITEARESGRAVSADPTANFGWN